MCENGILIRFLTVSGKEAFDMMVKTVMCQKPPNPGYNNMFQQGCFLWHILYFSLNNIQYKFQSTRQQYGNSLHKQNACA